MTTREYKSIFYPELPVELWFIIYKIEHQSWLKCVNREIKTLSNEVYLLNKKNRHFFPQANLTKLWNIKDLIEFKKTTGAFIDTEPCQYQGTIIFDSIDFAGHEPSDWVLGLEY